MIMLMKLLILFIILIIGEAFIYWIAYKNGDTKIEDKKDETDTTKF